MGDEVLVFFLFFIRCWTDATAFGISIAENGYRDIRVSFPANAAPDVRKHLLQTTKDLFSSSSVVLYVATKRRGYFRNVTFIIPASWGNETEWADSAFVHRNHWDVFQKADVAVTGEMSGSRPFTLHAEGCQMQGLRIYLPQNFLLSQLDQRSKDSFFVHQWAQFRYGVFEEGGFEDDARFPVYYSVLGSTAILVTSCSSTQLEYNFTNEDGNDCEPEVDLKTGRPTGPKCLCHPITENATMQSSLMYQQILPKTSEFCEADLSLDKSHNPTTPSKHNTLCAEEGVWFVILRNPDFYKGRNQARRYVPNPISFKYVQESTIKVIVAVETSKFMQDHNRYNELKNALSKFILYDLPFHSKFGVVHYSSDAVRMDSLSTLTSQETRNSFLESFHIPDEATSSTSTCPMCAMRASIQMLETDSEVDGGIVVLVTTNVCDADSEDSLKEQLVSKGIRLFVISYQDEIPTNCTWESLVASTGGLVFHIAESASSWTTLDQLYLSFASVVKEFSWASGEHVLIAKETMKGGEDVFFEVTVDETIGEEVRIFVTGPNFSIQKSPLVADFTMVLIGDEVVTEFQRQPFMPAWIFEINRKTTDTIIFKSKWNDKTAGPLLVMVTGKPRSDVTTISARAWFGNSNQQVIRSDPTPLKLYTEITSGNIPIIGADVHAEIFHPDKRTSFISLRDNGIGDPDITKYDGIYSSYFSGYTIAGYYTILIRASSNGTKTIIRRVSTENCCGSFMPGYGAEPIGPFVRYVGPLSFLRATDNPAVDIYPPNRILDLEVVDFDRELMKCELRWTAAGENYTEGKASSYQIKVFADRTDLRRSFDTTGVRIDEFRDLNWMHGASVGDSSMQCVINLPEGLVSDSYFIGVRAVDSANNTGPVSNTVQVHIGRRKRKIEPQCEGGRDGSGQWNSGDLRTIAISLLFLLL